MTNPAPTPASAFEEDSRTKRFLRALKWIFLPGVCIGERIAARGYQTVTFHADGTTSTKDSRLRTEWLAAGCPEDFTKETAELRKRWKAEVKG